MLCGLAVLALLFVPFKNPAKKSSISVLLGDAKLLCNNLWFYSGDHEGKFPEKLELLVPQYTTDPSVFMMNYPGELNQTPYIYHPGFKENQEPRVILFHTPKLDGDRVAGFSDGTASQLREEEFQKLMSAQKSVGVAVDGK